MACITLAEYRPDLVKEWHPTKNGGLTPADVSCCSQKKVWWQCKMGHEWEAAVNNRYTRTGCPYCSGRKVLQGSNDLATKNPKLAAEWHPTKNGELRPANVSSSSSKKVWWLCEKGHEWQAIVSDRNKGRGCPYCSELKALPGGNDLATKNPALATEWHPTKNGDLTPSDVTRWSGRKVWWLCAKGHEWEATVANRNNGAGCPYCSGRKALQGSNDLATKNPKLAAEWHPTKNGELRPTDVSCGSGQIVWWLCEKGHEWEAMVANRNNGSGCPYCSGQKVLPGYNDLATKNPKLAAEWHPTKNGELKPTDVSRGSNRIVWWLCEKGHEWEAMVNDRNKGAGCLYCSGRNVLPGFDDLATQNPPLAAEWHPTKNGGLAPFDVKPYSTKRVWWLCEKGHEWDAAIYARNRGSSCPYCSGQKVLPGYNDLATKNPNLAAEWYPTKNGELKPKTF